MLTPNSLLWIAALFVAFGLMMSAMAHREQGLIAALKDFVDRYVKREAAKQASSETPGSPPETPDS